MEQLSFLYEPITNKIILYSPLKWTKCDSNIVILFKNPFHVHVFISLHTSYEIIVFSPGVEINCWLTVIVNSRLPLFLSLI